jgi:hypothetical protein
MKVIIADPKGKRSTEYEKMQYPMSYGKVELHSISYKLLTIQST